MQPDWKWWASRDGETFTVGPCEDREEAIEEMRDSGEVEAGESFVICEAHQAPVDFSPSFDAADFIESADEWAVENFGGESGPDTFTDDITTEQMHDLEQCVRMTISRWQKRHGIAPKPWVFTAQRGEETINQEEHAEDEDLDTRP